jgi:hypothetical protein
MRHVLIAVALPLLACSREATPVLPVASESTVRAPRSPLERIAVIPARFDEVAWMSGAQAMLVNWAESLGDPPACLGELRAGLDGYVQATDYDYGVAGAGLLVFQGRFDRQQVESCLVRIGANLDMKVEVERDGVFTRLSAGGGTLYLAWTPAGDVVSHDERAVVEEVLAARTSLRDNPDLMTLLEQVDTSQPLWAASNRDLGRFFVEVSSHGTVFAGRLPTEKLTPGAPLPPLVVGFVFGSLADATVAAERLRALGGDPRFSPALQAVIGKLDPTVKGKVVELNAMALFEDLSILGELQALMEQATTSATAE